ncbi:MAG: hypothetical protein OZSIB_3792 [Candidatus Ozemobacter sibiricus]|jgi:hypothetical protein|uniref:Uncharacterized protein n=1 Tax=Candidatus Ozemobacter sibiricus TaxID=2268124 RepID=A0A367ZP95_9BACT|nr:MAG: hypothetical protein OZSIB_3792 [Candidatus Ozemobacter sibiricus]
MNVQRETTPPPVVATPLGERAALPGGLRELFEIDLFRQAVGAPTTTENQHFAWSNRRRPTAQHPKI